MTGMEYKYSYIHGFEDYKIVDMYSYMFSPTCDSIWPAYSYICGSKYLINKDLPVRCHNEENKNFHYNTVHFTPSLYTDNKELLEKAKKVYVHPSCKLSRSMMAEKYKKSLDPWTADVVVVPKPEYSDLSLDDYALFINDTAKMIVRLHLDEKFKDYGIVFKEGDKVRDYMLGKTFNRTDLGYSLCDLLESEFFFQGELLTVPTSCNHVMDILTYNIPRNKTVYETSIQESLSSETNQLDFDSLISIKDMLESSDEDTVSAGLKSLSMMDWMHYPNSIKFILRNVDSNRWRWNKATGSTSVKYMLHTITGQTSRGRWPGDYDFNIFKEDFELLKELKMHCDSLDEKQMLSWLRCLNFMMVDPGGMMTPVLRERTA
jgi:hypothetical protein